MSQDLARLFHDYDRGGLSRRQLLQALGVAAVARPVAALAQGSCGGARAGTPGCDPTPAKMPFEPTGWTTAFLDHFTMQVADYQKEAAYYAALMNWKVRSDDGKQARLDIGDVGSVIIRGGYPAPPPREGAPAGAGAGGRGGGRGGGARVPLTAVWDSFCFAINQWDKKKVEAELRKRGLDPIADDDKSYGFESFHVKDPDGFNLQISNGNRKTRYPGEPKGKLSTAAPFESTNWKTVWVDHISFATPDYKRSVAFYQALLGWKPTGDEGSQNECWMGDAGNILIRRGNASANAAAGTPTAVINHIAFGLQPWDPDAVKAELDKRGLTGRADTGGKGDIHTAPYQSYHTTTPNGYDLQISGTTKATRDTR